MNKTKIERLKAIKEEFARTQARLAEVRKLEESASYDSMSTLLENDLEQAELVLAAQDIMNKLQNMAEDLAKMNAQDLFPLVDKMKAAFGQEAAHSFEESSQGAIADAMQTVRRAKDELGNSIMRLEGKIPPNDMAAGADMDAGADMTTDIDPTADASMDNVDAAMDDFGGADAASGPEAEPLGRARRESVEGGKALNESILREAAGRQLLMTESLDSLIDWVLTEAAAGMPEAHFRTFATSVAKKAASDPVKFAGWAGEKKYGKAAMAQLGNPERTQGDETQAQPDLTVVGEGKTFKNSDDDDSNWNKKHSDKARQNARRNKQKGDDLEEGKTFRKGEDEDDKADRFKARQDARREKGKGEDKIDESTIAAQAVARIIEANIQKNGKGMAASAVKEAVAYLDKTVGLNESEGGNQAKLVEAFQSAFGMTPAAYSIQKIREAGTPLNSLEKKNANAALGAMAGKMGANKAVANQSVQSAMTGMDGQERSAATKLLNKMKQDGTNPKNAGEFAQAASTMVNDDDAVNENINAAHWPVDTHGQYKGEPMSTDYGKLKPLTAPKAGATEGGAPETKVEEPKVDGAKAPEGNPFAKKAEADEPKEDSTEEKVEEGFGKVLKKAALGAGAAAALASGSAAARTSDPIGDIIATGHSDAPKSSSKFDAAFGKGASSTGDRFDADAAAAQSAANDVKKALRSKR